MADQDYMFKAWGTVVENKPSADKPYCRLRIKYEKADGYTVFLTTKAFQNVFDVAKTLTVDSRVYVGGSIGYSSYQKEGEATPREEIFVAADRIHVETLAPGPAPLPAAPRAAPAQQAAMTFEADDELPF